MPRLPIDYSRALIYKLVCKNPEIKDIYVGSTTDYTKRKNQHKYDCNSEMNEHYNYKVYQFIRNNGGWDNWSMELIEYYPTDDKLKLLKREGEIIRELQATLNIEFPGRNRKEYYIDNKISIAEINKKYYENNKDAIRNYKKLYFETNKEHIAEINKKYRDNNKEVIQQKKKENFTCDCGSCIRIGGKSEHINTIKHIKYVESLGV
jgi:hypothetical protein